MYKCIPPAIRKFLFLAFFPVIACSGPGKAPQPTVRMQDSRLDSLFRQLHEDQLFNGTILVAGGDTVLYQNSFGMADHSSGRMLNDSSVFELASVSKQFTAMGIMLLKAKGLLSYEDSLRHFFPELTYPGITIRQLLQHTSGLPDYMDLVMKHTAADSIATNADMIRLLATYKPAPLFKPGTKWEYSNTGYALLASVIEKVSGKNYGSFLQAYIFTPLGMRQTEVYRRRFEKRTIPNYALGYVNAGSGRWVLPDSLDATATMVSKLDGIVGDGTVNASAPDLFKWSRALDQNKLLSKAEQDEMFRPAVTADGKEQAYGFGWALGKREQIGKFYGHSGGWPGYGTYIEKHPETGKLLILLSNHDRPEVKTRQLFNIIYHITDTAWQTISMDASALKEYMGVYELDPDFVISITVDKGRIYEQATGQQRLEIFPSAPDLFFLKAVDARLKFTRDVKNKITGLVLIQNGQEMPGKKIK